MDECPTSAIPDDIWQVVELFFYCHRRVPGWATWQLQCVGLPRAGGIEDQDAWTAAAFSVLEAEFYSLQADLERDRNPGGQGNGNGRGKQVPEDGPWVGRGKVPGEAF